TLNELRRNRLLWYKLHVFIYDLQNFRSNEASRTRLDTVISIDYIGHPYFSDEEAEMLRSTTVDVEGGQTLQEVLDSFFGQKLEARLQGRAQSEYDFGVCAAHDLAPLFEQALGVGKMKKNKAFGKTLKKRGLDLADGD
ncbi:hypothetical protein K491DRAFT_554672, partial [Lophiostoma macrostomum CBS 122681]